MFWPLNSRWAAFALAAAAAMLIAALMLIDGPDGSGRSQGVWGYVIGPAIVLPWMIALSVAQAQGTSVRLQLVPGLRRRLVIALTLIWVSLGTLMQFVMERAAGSESTWLQTWNAALSTLALLIGAGWMQTRWWGFFAFVGVLLSGAVLWIAGFRSLAHDESYSSLMIHAACTTALTAIGTWSISRWIGVPGEARLRQDQARQWMWAIFAGPSGMRPTHRDDGRLYQTLEWIAQYVERRQSRRLADASKELHGFAWVGALWSSVAWVVTGLVVLTVGSAAIVLAVTGESPARWPPLLHFLFAAMPVAFGAMVASAQKGLLHSSRVEIALWRLTARAPATKHINAVLRSLLLRSAWQSSGLTLLVAVSVILFSLDASDWLRALSTAIPLSLLAAAPAGLPSPRSGAASMLAPLVLGSVSSGLFLLAQSSDLALAVCFAVGVGAMLPLLQHYRRLQRLPPQLPIPV